MIPTLVKASFVISAPIVDLIKNISDDTKKIDDIQVKDISDQAKKKEISEVWISCIGSFFLESLILYAGWTLMPTVTFFISISLLLKAAIPLLIDSFYITNPNGPAATENNGAPMASNTL